MTDFLLKGDGFYLLKVDGDKIILGSVTLVTCVKHLKSENTPEIYLNLPIMSGLSFDSETNAEILLRSPIANEILLDSDTTKELINYGNLC